MNVRIAMLAVGCVALSGCAQYEAQQQADATAQAQARAANDDAQCRSNGVVPGSPGYAQCRMNLDNQHAAAVQPQNPFTGSHLYHR